jgi:hypothetical protein
MGMHRTSTEDLFSEYLAVVNRAIAQNRDRVPYKQLFAGGKKLLGDRTIEAVVYDDSTTLARFTIGLADDRIEIMERDHGTREHAPTWEWKVSEKHLENVVADPQPYIESPLRLDLDWLETRIKE